VEGQNLFWRVGSRSVTGDVTSPQGRACEESGLPDAVLLGGDVVASAGLYST